MDSSDHLMAQLMTGGVGLFIMVLTVVILILWVFMPFAVFGTKDHLQRIEKAIKDGNKTLENIEKALAESSTPKK